jgi:hypothetical protein
MVALAVKDNRAAYVKDRLIQINKHAASIIIESGTLLREYKANGYAKEDGFSSFDEAIEAYHSSGLLDYGARQARYLISVVDMVDNLSIPAEKVEQIGVSKLREIAGVPGEGDKKALLDKADSMSVAEVQKEAKKLRDKALGRESDPLIVTVLKTTESQQKMFNECISEARRIYALPEEMSEASILVDVILTAWFNVRELLEAEQVEASL